MLQYIQYFNQAGIVVAVEPLLSNKYVSEMQRGRRDVISVLKGYLKRAWILLSRKHLSYDLIWIEKELFPWVPYCFERFFLGGRADYILDYDDAVFNLYSEHRYWIIRKSLNNKHRKIQRNAKYITVGSRYLAQYANDSNNNVFEVPSAIDINRYPARSGAKPTSSSNVAKVVWIGQKSTSIFLHPYIDLLQGLVDEGLINIISIGFNLNQLGLSCTYVPWSEDEEVAALQSADIGISPLNEGSFERGKCGYKVIQYMAAGLPVVASNVGEHVNILSGQDVGYLVETQGDWESAIRALIANPVRAKQMGLKARELVEKKYSIQATHSFLISLFRAHSYQPLVSIITPAFNAERMIRDAVASVRTQTYQNWEMIIVDDRSTDKTTEVVREMAFQDNRIQLICLDSNRGYPGRVKNVALKHVRGELVAFLDADDTWLPSKLAEQVKCMENRSIDLCYSGGMFVDSDLVPRLKFTPKYESGWMFDRLLTQYEINNQTVVVRRSSIARLSQPYFNPKLRIGEDYDFFMRIASSGTLCGLKKDHVRYRVHPESISIRFGVDAAQGLAEVLRWTRNDPDLSQRCHSVMKHAQAKLAYYHAKTAMFERQKKLAQSYLRPFVFVNWRYLILYYAAKSHRVWRVLMRFDRRHLSNTVAV